MTPKDFIAKWQKVQLSERSACQQHFLDLCELLGQPKPAEGFNNKVKLTTRKAYGFRTFEAVQLALYHNLGALPDPELTHRFC